MSALATTPTPAASRPPGAPWPIPDAASYLTVSPRHLFRLIDAGRVKSILLGRRRLIADAEVRRLAAEGC